MFEFIARFCSRNKKAGQFGSGVDADSSSCSGEINRRTRARVKTTGAKYVGGETHRDSEYKEHPLPRQASTSRIDNRPRLREALNRCRSPSQLRLVVASAPVVVRAAKAVSSVSVDLVAKQSQTI
jgi:hypothetical protein